MTDPALCAKALQQLAALEDEDTAEDDDTYLKRCYALARSATRADAASVAGWRAMAIHSVLQGMLAVDDNQSRNYFDEALQSVDCLRNLGVERGIYEPLLADALVHAASKPWGHDWLEMVDARRRIEGCEDVWADLTSPQWGWRGQKEPQAKMLRASRRRAEV